jgi:hypothetical protein
MNQQCFQEIYFKVARTCITRTYQVDMFLPSIQFITEMRENIRRDLNLENIELVDVCEQFPLNVVSEDKRAFNGNYNQSLHHIFRDRDIPPSFYIRPIVENVAININDIEQGIVQEAVAVAVVAVAVEVQQMHVTPGLSIDYVHTCVVCLTDERSILTTPCNHMCLCNTCATHTSITMCPLCRTQIETRITVFV